MTNIAPLARGAHRPADAVDDVLDGATAVELARERLHEARAVSRDDTVPHRDGRELHNLPDVSVHGLSASTPPERRRPRLHDGRLHLRVRGHHGVWLRDGDTSPLTGAALERVRESSPTSHPLQHDPPLYIRAIWARRLRKHRRREYMPPDAPLLSPQCSSVSSATPMDSGSDTVQQKCMIG
mgnify:CR=1 FL=1